MGTFDQLNQLLAQVEGKGVIIGGTVAELMVVVYAIIIMLNNDQSPQARTERWEKLKRVFMCAGIIAAATVIIGTATGLGQQL